MRISTENKQAVYESVMNALSKTVKGVLDKKVNESKEIENVYYAKTSNGKYVIYLTQHFPDEYDEYDEYDGDYVEHDKNGKLYIAVCARALESYARKFDKHKEGFDINPKGDFKINGEHADDLFYTTRHYERRIISNKNSSVTEKYHTYEREFRKMFDDYIRKYSIKTYDEFITNLDKDGSPLRKVFDEVKVEQKQKTINNIPTDAFAEKIDDFDKKEYIKYRKDLTYEYGNLLSSVDKLVDSNSKVYAIMYLNYINGYYQNLIERLMPLNPLKAIKILNQMVKVTQKYIIDDANFGQK